MIIQEKIGDIERTLNFSASELVELIKEAKLLPNAGSEKMYLLDLIEYLTDFKEEKHINIQEVKTLKGYAILESNKTNIGEVTKSNIDERWPTGGMRQYLITPIKKQAEEYIKKNPSQTFVEVTITQK